MNMILIERREVAPGNMVELSDQRAAHIRDVLRPEIGRELRIGLIDGPRGAGVVKAVTAGTVILECKFEAAPPAPSGISLLLALPRPKVMRRLWAPLASFGVDRIILTNAAKVERMYFDTNWLDASHYRPLLVEGLQQAGLTRLPEVTLRRRFRPLVEDELKMPGPGEVRLLAHPGDHPGVKDALIKAGSRVMLAVGPEGGWDAFELDLLDRHGFRRVSMRCGPLRTDVACIALLALVREHHR